nr:hypothetical protein [Tanacetum cinerariifolium]
MIWGCYRLASRAKGADEELSDGGSLRVIVYGYNGLPMLPLAPPSPDYIPGLEEPQTPPAPQDEDEHEPMFIQPHDLDFVPEPIYPVYIPLEGEHILLAEEQPLPPVVSPTAELLEYVAESDPKEDPEEDNADDEDEDEEEEEHLAPADSAIVIPTNELVSLPEGTEPVIPPPSTDTATTGARITGSVWLDVRPQLHYHHHHYHYLCTCHHLLTIGMISLSRSIPKTEMPPRKRLCLSILGSRYEAGESFTARPTGGRGIDYGFVSTLDAEARRRGIGEVRYGIKDTWVDPTETDPEIAPMTVRERVDLLMEDKIAHQETIQIVEDEAYAAREAWDHSIGLSQTVHSKLQTHQEQMHQTEIAELQETGRRHQAQMAETLRAMGDMRREMGDMHAELLALREQPRRAEQPRGDARVLNHQDAPRDADSHI